SQVGSDTNPTIQALVTPGYAFRDQLTTLLNLPGWLGHNYNLPAPRINAVTGALEVLPDNAPGQGGFGDALTMQFDETIWSDARWMPTSPENALTSVASLAARAIAPLPTYRTYVDQGWLPHSLRLGDAWTPHVPHLSHDRTPAALLDHLPHPLHITPNLPEWLGLFTAVQDIQMRRSVDWAQAALEDALPTLPDLPPRDAAAWRATWFTDDTLGIANPLSAWMPLARPDIPVPVLGVNDMK
ncbi:MAG: hypothetical protein K8I60_09335, partial [Anaerolineae bacterium]|nr:hypothetical protein [Anaerolineae bacterium]